MKNSSLAIVVLVFLFGFLLIGIMYVTSPGPRPAEPTYERIISMVPSITEVLFALDRGRQVVGVTDYCTYPPEAREKAQLGGYFNPNYEAILALEPDMVMTMPEQAELRERLADFGIATLSVNQSSTAGIIRSIEQIGRVCGVEGKAQVLAAGLEGRMREITRKTADLPHPRVLICIGRTVGCGDLEDLYIAGGFGFYHDLVTAAGGVNVSEDTASQYPSISKEGLLLFNPEVVLDMIPDLEKRAVTAERAVRDWNVLPRLAAVKTGRVHAITEQFATIPGPRFVFTLERIARLLHPEVKWDG